MFLTFELSFPTKDENQTIQFFIIHQGYKYTNTILSMSDITEVVYDEKPILMTSRRCEMKEIGKNMAEMLLMVGNYLNENEIKKSSIPKAKALKIVHKGDYSDLPKSYGKVFSYMKENGIEEDGSPWEQYITDPRVEKDKSKWITHIYRPIK